MNSDMRYHECSEVETDTISLHYTFYGLVKSSKKSFVFSKHNIFGIQDDMVVSLFQISGCVGVHPTSFYFYKP